MADGNNYEIEKICTNPIIFTFAVLVSSFSTFFLQNLTLAFHVFVQIPFFHRFKCYHKKTLLSLLIYQQTKSINKTKYPKGASPSKEVQLQIFSKLGSRLLGSKNYLRGAKTVKIDLCTTEHNSVKFACSLFVSVFASMSRACYYHHISIHCYPLLRYDLSTNNECVNVNQNTSKGFLEV